MSSRVLGRKVKKALGYSITSLQYRVWVIYCHNRETLFLPTWKRNFWRKYKKILIVSNAGLRANEEHFTTVIILKVPLTLMPIPQLRK